MRDAIHFVTGRLAESALRRIVEDLASKCDFDYSIEVLPITVAALMSPKWIAKHIHPVSRATKVVIPGYCHGDLEVVEMAVGKPVERGPRDLLELPEFFGRETPNRAYGAHDIEIIAEINHAPRLALEDVLQQASRLVADGADVIDLGCDPGETWDQVAEYVKALRAEGHRVSIDSMNPVEATRAVQAGAELVLSVNDTNRQAAADWDCEVIVIPDDIGTLGGLEDTIEFLDKSNVRYRIDPILEPIGFGFAASLARFLEVRRRFAQCEMMMGIGNLTELTDVDSAGINVLLMAICQELQIRSVLTTQVINWARSSVQECAHARRLVYHCLKHEVLPKRLDPSLVMLRDTKLIEHGDQTLSQLATRLRDHNLRIYAERGEIHILGRDLQLRGSDPFTLFDALMETKPKNMDSSHAFYLGYELCKAVTALTLGKQYRQDEALDWGLLTVPEEGHRRRKRRTDESS